MHRATFNSLADEIVQSIGLFAATFEPTGPPSGLIPLLKTSRSTYHCLNFDTNPHLYARIFRIQFDTSALSRRFGRGQINARSLAKELRRRWETLTRIRIASQAGQDIWEDQKRGLYTQEFLKTDLTIAYLMLLESDGMNATQLIQWSHLPDYLAKYHRHVLSPFHLIPEMPPESEETSLFAWLTWFCMDYKRTISSGLTDLAWLMTPYVFGTFAYNGSLAPWPCHYLPLSSSKASVLPSPPSSVQPAPAYQLTRAHDIFTVNNTPKLRPRLSALTHYFGLPLSISPPLLSQAATMCWLLSKSRLPLYIPNTAERSRAELLAAANSAGAFTSASDLASGDVLAFSTRSYTPSYMQTKFPTVTDSRVYDDEFKRLAFCRDPFAPASRLRELGMPRYRFTKGSLSGEWDGRSIGIDFAAYERIMGGEPAINVLEEDNLTAHDMHSWRIEEHYYRKGRMSALAQASKARVGGPLRVGSPLNAHLPALPSGIRPFTAWGHERWQKGVQMRTSEGITHYETWDPAHATEEDEDDDDDDDDEHIHVVITGDSIARSPEIPESHAWSCRIGSSMHGTIRKWDGLITLKVNPIDNYLPAGVGQWIWRGYVIGSGSDANWVGRYRHANVDVDRQSYEGVFTMVKRTSN